MYSPVFNYKEKSQNELWNERKKLTETVGDHFFKRSQRYRENPDYSPKHVGATWAVSDACDYVRPSATQMGFNYTLTENSVPLYKAYNIYENSGQNWEQRLGQYEGTVPVDKDLQNHDSKNYHSSGGIGKHSYDYKKSMSNI